MDKTTKYYEKWLGQDGCLASENPLQFIYSEERNKVQPGYGDVLDVYVWAQPGRVVVSYGDKALPKLWALKERLYVHLAIPEMVGLLGEVFGGEVKHQVKYWWGKVPSSTIHVPKTLTASDYSDYEAFFVSCHPTASDVSWLCEYFEEMVADGLCVGMYEGELLVCATDAPMVPYLAEEFQEIGVNTLPEFRRKGYGVAVCQQAVSNILQSGKLPLWSTSGDNLGSQRLAERVGFEKLGDVLVVKI